MQPPTEPNHAQPAPPQRGDEAELYRRHHRDLHRAVARVVRAPHELIEDACQTAWAILLRNQPDRHSIFGWLRVVAIHEAYRLSALGRREMLLVPPRSDQPDWTDTIVDSRTLDDAIRTLDALEALASLPQRQRTDLVLKVAGFSYDEIAELTGRPHLHQRQQVAGKGASADQAVACRVPPDACPASRRLRLGVCLPS